MFTLRRALISLLLAVAAGLLYVGFVTSVDEERAVVRDAAVRREVPARGELVLRQTDIGAELAIGYTGVLQVDGIEIPEDQLVRNAGLNTLTFTPGPDKEITRLRPGRHTATVVLWLVGESRADSRRYTWEFRVH